MTFSLRTSILSASTLFALLLATQAHAAGSILITQQSPIGNLGDYVVTFPSGTTVTLNDMNRKSFPIAEIGTYTIKVTPPDGAKLATTVRTGTAGFTTGLREFTFQILDTEEVTVEMNYSYEGTILVDTDPQGTTFELLGPNGMRMTGTTPGSFTGLPPSTYRLTFMKREGCNLVSPLLRELQANGVLRFFGRFTCGVSLPTPQPAPIVPTLPIPQPNFGRMVRVSIALQQAEVLPGNTARTTITVNHIGTRTVHDLVISAQFDSAFLDTINPLPRFGTVHGNVVRWEIPELLAGQSWTVTIPFRMQDTVEQGTRTAVTARVEAGDLAPEEDPQSLVAIAEIGVTELPQTGIRLDVLFLLLSTIATAFLARKSIHTMAEEKA